MVCFFFRSVFKILVWLEIMNRWEKVGNSNFMKKEMG